MHSQLSLIAALCGVALVAPFRRTVTHVMHEERAMDPVDWEISHRLDPAKVLPMRFGLMQSNLHRVEELLMEVSHPDSAKYGQHYTPSEDVIYPDTAKGGFKGPESCGIVAPLFVQVNPGSTVNDPEGVCEQVIFSGGGFSNIFSTPFTPVQYHKLPFTPVQFNNSGNDWRGPRGRVSVYPAD